jgi:predicted RNA binding protein YcfA (HicA-like mRNA interferase family)
VAKLPTLKPREVSSLLEKLGFAEVRQRGSHKQYRHADGRGTTVPYHAGRDISPTLLRKIAKDIGLTAEQFVGREEGRAAQQPDAPDERAQGSKPPARR